MKRPKPDPIKPGQRSVWAFPRPPAVEPVSEHVRIVVGGRVLADSNRCVRVVETSHPPVYFFPPNDADAAMLRKAEGSSFCEWKGRAEYFDVLLPGGRALERVGFAYPEPTRLFTAHPGWLSFYAGPMSVEAGDGCFVGDERAEPQPGVFYSGWITSVFVGPFKGVPGSMGW